MGFLLTLLHFCCTDAGLCADWAGLWNPREEMDKATSQSLVVQS